LKIFNKTIQITFDSDKKIEQIKNHKEFTENQPCPKCHGKKLNLLLLEEGKTGWELVFECRDCQTKGVLSNTGFRVDFASKTVPVISEKPKK
jgi:excinuclease UvrABC ATPase subunit